MSLRRTANAALPGLFGIAAFFLIWEVIGRYKLAGFSWPALSTVLDYILDPSHRALLGRATGASYMAALIGYASGALIGFILTFIVRAWRGTRPGMDRLVSLVHTTPAIALAPVFMVLLDRDHIPAALSALAVFYLIYVAATSGLEAAHRAHHDLFSAIGASPATRFFRLELPAALPAIVSGLKLAVPVAFMGTIVGEWFGASRGLGLLMISAMQNFQIPLLWSAVLITVTSSLIIFGLMDLAEKIVHRRFG